MGAAWDSLPASIRAAHGAGETRGFMRVRGGGWLARMLARALGFPAPCPRLTVRLQLEPCGAGLRWVRQMGPCIITSRQWVANGLLLESFGPFLCAFRLTPEALGLRYRQAYAALRLGRLELRLPRCLAPRIAALVSDAARGAATAVEISLPLIGLLLAYDGVMEPTRSEQPT